MEKLVKILKPEVFSDIESDGFIYVKDLRKGVVFYECELNSNFELTVVEDPIYTKSGWSCLVVNSKGETLEIYVHKKYQKFTRFYKYPIYLEEIEDLGPHYVVK